MRWTGPLRRHVRALRAWRLQIPLLVSLAAAVACVPTSRATIQLGAEHPLGEMDRIEAVVQELGLSRIWFRSEGDGRAPRFEHEGRVISSFEVTWPRVIGADIAWKRANGGIEITFAERDTEFSDEGKLLLRKLLEQLRKTYGDRVVIVDDGAA